MMVKSGSAQGEGTEGGVDQNDKGLRTLGKARVNEKKYEEKQLNPY